MKNVAIFVDCYRSVSMFHTNFLLLSQRTGTHIVIYMKIEKKVETTADKACTIRVSGMALFHSKAALL
jgi:hypothetical protein